MDAAITATPRRLGYRLPEVAKMLGVSVKTLRRSIARGEFPKPRRIGSGLFLSEKALADFLDCPAKGR